jgi:tetratricopeptide (TPR) repeat protein
MKKIAKLAYLLGALPLVSFAQNDCGLECDPSSSGVLFGGIEYPVNCYLNSQKVSQNPELASEYMLEDCDFAIRFVGMEKDTLAATHTNRGVIRVALGNYDGAFSDFNIGMTLMPEAAQILVNRGNAFYHTGNYQMAIEDYNHSIELGFADFPDVYLNLGKSYERLGNITQAQQNYQRAVDLSPDQAEARSLLDGLLSQPSF